MDDVLKHLDTHGEDIRELVEQVMQQRLLPVANEDAVCPTCLAVALLEFAAYAATSAGASAGQILEAAATGAMNAEDDTEISEAEPPTQSRH